MKLFFLSLFFASSLFAYQGRGLKDQKTRLARRMITLLDQVIWSPSPDTPLQSVLYIKAELVQLLPLVPKEYGNQLMLRLEQAQKDLTGIKNQTEIGNWHNSLRGELVSLLQLEIAQTAIPQWERSQKLYLEHCSSCHGAAGNGEGPLSKKLPAALMDWTKKETQDFVSVSMVYHYLLEPPSFSLQPSKKQKIMPSILDVLDADEMWSISFYWKSFGLKPQPVTVSFSGLSLQEIAGFSDLELQKKYPSLWQQVRLVESFSSKTPRKVYR